MSRIRSEGTKMYVQTAEEGAAVPMTAITKAAPCVITFSALPDEFVDGRIVVPDGTGFRSIDGKPFQIDVSGSTITLLDSDTSDEPDEAVLGTVTGVGMTEFCAGTANLTEGAGTDIDMTTMCDDERVTDTGLPAAPTWSATGFHDKDDASQSRMYALKRSKEKVVFAVQYRDNSGYTFLSNVNNYETRTGVDQPVAITAGGTVSKGTRRLSLALITSVLDS